MTHTPRTVAQIYFETWANRDFAGFRENLADDATFVGPMGTANNADECTKGIEGMSKFVTGIDTKQVFVEGNDVLTWYELQTADADPIPTANWIHVENGKVKSIRVAFDPRPIAPPS